MQKKYAALLAVTGGLAVATSGCGGAMEEPAATVADEGYPDEDYVVPPPPVCCAAACFAAGCCAAEGCCGAGCCAAEGCEAAACCVVIECFAAGCAAEGCCAAGECVAFGDEALRDRTIANRTRTFPARGITNPTFMPTPITTAAPPPPPPDPVDERPSLDIPSYPTWPPEEASSRVNIGNLITNRAGMSLYDAGQRLRAALDLADYSEHSFYSVPGGFILVTQREQIDTIGQTMPGLARFQQPGEGRDESLFMRIRDLFLERPPSYYRYLAIVITDRPFGASETALTASQATTNVQQGSTALSRDARDIAFTDDFLAIALIYEYENPGVGTDLTMIEPGRIPPAEHLTRSGLRDALPRAFSDGGAR